MTNVLDFTDPDYLMSRHLEIVNRLAALELAVKNLTAHNPSMDAIAQITDILDNRDDLDSESKITLINIIIGQQHHR